MTSKLIPLLLLIAAPAMGQRTLGSGETGANWSVVTTSYPLGAAPADSVEPADQPDVGFTESQWIVTGDNLTTDRAVSGSFYVNPSDNTADRKLRFQCEPNDRVLPVDFLLQDTFPMVHPHAPFGMVNWNKFSNFAAARANPSSSCGGGPLFTQIYEEPVMFDKLPKSGAIVVRRPQTQTVYYVGKLQKDPHTETWVRRDFMFGGGVNPLNFNDQARRAAYAAGGFAYPGSPDSPAGFGGWTCETGPTQTTAAMVTFVPARMKDDLGAEQPYAARYLKGPNGENPWGGSTGFATNTCVAYSASVPASLLMTLVAPQCWNRNHLQVPNGRDHLWYAARKSDSSVVDACPTLPSGAPYARVPEPQFKSQWAVKDFDDFKNMFFASDRMRASTTECPDAASPCDGTTGGNTPATIGGVYYSRVSLDPCRRVSVDFCNGGTGHFGWGYGAKSSIFDEGQRECLGITVRGVAPQYAGGAECNFGTLSRTRALLSGGPSPNPALSAGCQAILQCFDSVPSKPRELYFTMPKGKSGPTHIMRPGTTM